MNLSLNLKKPLAVFQKDISEAQVRLRAILRAMEDGSIHKHAGSGRPGAILQVQLDSSAMIASAATATACNECFLGFVRALVELMDRLLAMRALSEERLQLPSGVTSVAQLDAHVGELIEIAYQRVARDTSLTNPAKVAKFDRLDNFERDATLCYFAVRRCLEHHGGVPISDLTVTYYRPYLVAGTAEIVKLGEPLPPNTGISLTAEIPRRELATGQPISFSEAEIEYIAFTLQHVIGPGFVNATTQNPG